MHFVFDFTECIRIQINIEKTRQILYPSLPGTSSKLKRLSIVDYLATAWRSWAPVYISDHRDTENCIANVMYYFDFLVSSIANLFLTWSSKQLKRKSILILSFKKTVFAC